MKRIARIAGIIAALLVAIAIAIPFLIDANQFRPALESRLTAGLGRDVKLGDLRVSLFSGGVSASNLSIADDPAFSKTPFLQAQSLSVGVEMMPLILSRKLNVTGLTIDQPQISLIETPAGVFNFSSIGGKNKTTPPSASAPGATQTPDLSIALLRISDGRMTFDKTGSKNKPMILDKLNIEVRNFAANTKFPITLSAGLPGGGMIQLDGTAGPVDAGDAMNTPFNATLHATHLDLVGSGLADPAADVAGIASVEGAAASANGAVDLTGKLKIEQLVLAKGGTPAKRPVEIDLAIAHSLAKQGGEVRRMAIHLGGATANLTGTYRLETEPATVNLRLSGSKMPLIELAALLPPLHITLPRGASIDQGTADVNLSSAGPLNALVTQGTMVAENARLANFDFASKLQVLSAFTGIRAQPQTMIQTLATNVRSTPGGTALDNVQLVVTSIGAITGAGTISPSQALNFRMRAAVAGGTLASLGGKGGIPFLIQGTADSPSVKPDVQGIVSDKLNEFTGGKTSGAAGGLLRGLFGGRKKP